VAPDGTTTAALLAATSTANDIRSVINGVVTGTSGTTYTVSAFVKTSGGANMYYQINAGGAAAAYFDLTAGTGLVGADLVAGITNKSVSIIPFPNGWYRVSFTLAPSATGTLGVYIGLCAAVSASGDNRSSVGVVGQGIYVWGVQVEQGSFGPTSHIPTTAAAVTRAVDGPSIAQANMGWFVAGPGSWFAEFIHQTTPTSNAPRIIGYPSAGGKTPLFVSATAQAAAFDGNAVVASVNTLTRGAVSKAVSAWAPSTGKVCLNGGAVASGSETTGFLDAATTGIVLFQTGIPLESSTGYLRRVQYWPRALSDTEMQQVTT
jgi:hypothetical protein